jgi:hypothetical protein
VDLAGVTKDGAFVPCPECKKKIWQQKESFALRPLKKEGAIYCADCGCRLGEMNICQACGSLYPDYCIIQAHKPVRRKLEKSQVSFGFSLGAGKRVRGIPTGGERSSRKSLLAGLATLVLLAVVIAGTGALYLRSKAEKEYAANYVLALYLIKSGADRSIASCTKISADWKAAIESTSIYVVKTDPKLVNIFNVMNGDLENVRQKMVEPPQKFLDANDKLGRLNDAYVRLYKLNLAPPVSYANFVESSGKLEKDFNRSAAELKSSLPDELKEQIRSVIGKYKNLQFVLE